MRALPHHYSKFEAKVGTNIQVEITGEAGGKWETLCTSNGWTLVPPSTSATSLLTIDQDNAWKLLSKGFSLGEAHRHVQIDGHQLTGEHFLSMLAVMA